MSSNIECIYDHDAFCFVCGTFIFKGERAVTIAKAGTRIVEEYKKHFQRDPLERNVVWSPSVSCVICFNKLTAPLMKMKIVTPMEWFEPLNHPIDCYFCRTIIPQGSNKRKRTTIEYPDVPSVKRARFDLEEESEATYIDDDDANIDMSQDFEGEASGVASQYTHTAENVTDADVPVHLEDDGADIV